MQDNGEHFRVQGYTSARSLPESVHDTAIAALEAAVKLMAFGVTNVSITDPQERMWTPAEFAKGMSELSRDEIE
jgi:hypothetical protein